MKPTNPKTTEKCLSANFSSTIYYLSEQPFKLNEVASIEENEEGPIVRDIHENIWKLKNVGIDCLLQVLPKREFMKLNNGMIVNKRCILPIQSPQQNWVVVYSMKSSKKIPVDSQTFSGIKQWMAA